MAQCLVVAAGGQTRAPVGQQGVERFAQLAAGGTRSGLAKAAEQGAQVDQLLQPLLQQFPVAVPAVLLGQALAA